jgi:hypothetical protein
MKHVGLFLLYSPVALFDDYIIINMTLSMTRTVSIADRVVSAVIFIRIF